MEKKITKRERFESLLNIPAVAADSELVNFINHELELLSKKNTTVSKAQAEKNAQREADKERILSIMTNEGKTCSAVLRVFPDFESTSKVSSLLKALVEDGKVIRSVVKGVAMFARA